MVWSLHQHLPRHLNILRQLHQRIISTTTIRFQRKASITVYLMLYLILDFFNNPISFQEVTEPDHGSNSVNNNCTTSDSYNYLDTLNFVLWCIMKCVKSILLPFDSAASLRLVKWDDFNEFFISCCFGLISNWYILCSWYQMFWLLCFHVVMLRVNLCCREFLIISDVLTHLVLLYRSATYWLQLSLHTLPGHFLYCKLWQSRARPVFPRQQDGTSSSTADQLLSRANGRLSTARVHYTAYAAL